MDRKLEIAEIRVAELEQSLVAAEERILAAQNDIQYYKGIARQQGQILKETGLEAWFSNNPEEIGETIQKIKDRYIRGEHMEMFERLNKEHPILNDAWNRYMMALRLIGLDGTNDPTPESN